MVMLTSLCRCFEHPASLPGGGYHEDDDHCDPEEEGEDGDADISLQMFRASSQLA